MRKQEYFIKKTIDVPVTKRKFFQILKEEVEAEYVPRALLIRNKSFTAKELNWFEKEGKLETRIFRGKKMYKKSDITGLVKSGEGVPKQEKLL